MGKGQKTMEGRRGTTEGEEREEMGQAETLKQQPLVVEVSKEQEGRGTRIVVVSPLQGPSGRELVRVSSTKLGDILLPPLVVLLGELR